MKPTYLLIGLIFSILSPAILLYGTVLEKGYKTYNPLTQADDWVKGNIWTGRGVSLVAAVSLWVMVPCFIYGIVGREESDTSSRSTKQTILSFEFFLVLYALVIIGLYYLCFTANAIAPHFPTIGTANASTTRSATLLMMSLLWLFAMLSTKLPDFHKYETIIETVSLLALLLAGFMSLFLGFGGSFLYELLGAELYGEYKTAVPTLIIASAVVSGIFWLGAQIYRGKATPIFAFLREKSERIPLLSFRPATIELVDIGFEQRSKLFRKRVKMLKITFRALLLGTVGLACYSVAVNTMNFMESILSVTHNPIHGLLKIPTAFLAWYLFSLIPIGVVIVFLEYLKVRFQKLEIPDFASDDIELRSLVNEISAEMGIRAPKTSVFDYGTVSPETNPMFVWKVGDKYLLFAYSEFVEDLRRTSDSVLRAAIAHELSHIKNEDVDDRMTIRALRKSLKGAFQKLSEVSFPLVLLFPFSVVLLDFLPYWLLFTTFLIFILLLSKGVIPHILFPIVISILAGIVYFPTAILLGKFLAMIEMNADLEASSMLGSTDPVKNMLLKTQKYEKNALDAVIDTMKPFRKMMDRLSWKDYFFKTPSIIIQVIHGYCLAMYSTIPTRLENLSETRIRKETLYTILGRFVFLLKETITDTFTNEHCRIGLVISAIYVAPIVFVVSVTMVVHNLPLSIFYAAASLFLVAKATKYAYSILEVLDKATLYHKK